MEKEVKDLMYELSKELLEENKFKQMRDSKIWAHFVRDNPQQWKKEHTLFINALFEKSSQFYQRLLSSPGGLEKFQLLRNSRKLFK